MDLCGVWHVGSWFSMLAVVLAAARTSTRRALGALLEGRMR